METGLPFSPIIASGKPEASPVAGNWIATPSTERSTSTRSSVPSSAKTSRNAMRSPSMRARTETVSTPFSVSLGSATSCTSMGTRTSRAFAHCFEKGSSAGSSPVAFATRSSFAGRFGASPSGCPFPHAIPARSRPARSSIRLEFMFASFTSR